MESSRKRKKVEHSEIKEIICTMQYTFFNKMQSIEDKIKKITSRYHSLEAKVDAVLSSNGIPCAKSVPSTMPNWPYEVITPENKPTNTIKDFPNGSWLGDPRNPDLRVRCKISEKDLNNINKTCSTPEKLALTLLDHLFDRELQACSNLAGTGKYKKRQLDPYKVFGIKCHVAYIFGTNEEDWNRIKISLDSKCRTQFRRVVRGLPLYVKRKRRYLYSLKRKSDNSDQDNFLSTNCDNRNSTQDLSKQELESTNYEETNSSQDLPKQELESTNYEDTNSSQEFSKQELESTNYDDKNLTQELLTKQESESLGEFSENNVSNGSFAMTGQPSTLSLLDGFKPEVIYREKGKFKVIRTTKEQIEQLKQNNLIHVISENCILPT